MNLSMYESSIESTSSAVMFFRKHNSSPSTGGLSYNLVIPVIICCLLSAFLKMHQMPNQQTFIRHGTRHFSKNSLDICMSRGRNMRFFHHNFFHNLCDLYHCRSIMTNVHLMYESFVLFFFLLCILNRPKSLVI